MSLKIGSSIEKIKINGSIISLMKFNGNKLYELFQEKIINLTPQIDSGVYKNSDETISNFVYDETTGKCDFDVTIKSTGSWSGLNLTNSNFSEHEGDYVRISVDGITSESSLSNCYLTHYINYNITDDIDNTAAWYNLNDFISYDDKVVIANEFKNLYFCVYSDVTVPITLHISGLKAEIITRPKITIVNDIYGTGYNKNYNFKTIERKRKKINNLLKDENTICFTQLSDIHFSTDNLTTQNGYSQIRGAILSSKMFDKCNAIIVGGDYWNANATENQISTLGANLEEIYEDAECSLFNVKGNHDTNMHSSSMEYLIGDKLFNNHFTQKNKYVNCSASFDGGEYAHQNYYYVDDSNINHRYIILNAFETDIYFDKFTELVGTSSSPVDFYPIWESLADNNEKYYCILEGVTLDGTGTYWFSRQLGYFQKNDNILYFYSYTDQNYNNYSVNTSAKTCSWNSYSNLNLIYPYSEGVQSSNQLNWLINSAMDMSNKNDWTVSIHVHDCMISEEWTTYFANDKPYMRKLFKAFKNGFNFNYSKDGISISKDFTTQGRIELIGVFAGHIHIDCYATVEGVDYYVNNGSVCQSELYSNVKIITPQRSWIGESSMSQNFYIYNRNTKKMDVVVLGVGDDKEFYLAPYKEEEEKTNLFNFNSSNVTLTNQRCNYVVDSNNKMTVTNTNSWSRVACTVSGLEANTNYTISADITNDNGCYCGFYTSSSYSMGTDTTMYKELTLTSDENGNFYVEFYTNMSGDTDTNTVIFDNVKLITT